MNDSMTFAVVLFTAIIAFIVAKLAPNMVEPEKPSPRPKEQFTFWRLLRGTMLIRREQVTEEWFEEVAPPQEK